MSVPGCARLHPGRDTLFQTSTITALLEGVYEGQMTFGALKRHGDFGLGTFNALDGELVALEGEFYQVKADGVAYPVDDSMKTPFAAVTFFDPDKSVVTNSAMDYNRLKDHLDSLLPTNNIFYAIMIKGRFSYVKTRSVRRQVRPYPPLSEAVKKQPTFEFHNVEGTLIGFRCPAFVEGINVPGYHLHFITSDRKAGGHLLECRLSGVAIGIDYTSELFMVLPSSGDFYKADLTGERKKELEKVEK